MRCSRFSMNRHLTIIFSHEANRYPPCLILVCADIKAISFSWKRRRGRFLSNCRHPLSYLRVNGRSYISTKTNCAGRDDAYIAIVYECLLSDTISLMMRSLSFCRFSGNSSNGFICICHIRSTQRESRDLAPTLLVRFAMSDVRSLLAVFVKRSVAGSRCSPRGAAWRLCKCCSWKRNRCLSPTPLASPLQSGYAYTLIPIASSAAMLRRILFRSSSGIPWKFRRARRDPSLLPRREEGAN